MVSVTLALPGPDQFWCGGLTFGPRSLFHRRRRSLLDHHQVRFSSGQQNLIKKTYHNALWADSVNKGLREVKIRLLAFESGQDLK